MGNVCVRNDLLAMCVCEGRSVGNVCVRDDLWAMCV